MRGGAAVVLLAVLGAAEARGQACDPSAVKTFGNGVVGTSTGQGFASRKRASRFALGEEARVTALVVSAQNPSSSAQVLKGVIYANGTTTPAALVAVTSQVSVPAGQALGWITLPFASPVLLAPGTYWLGDHTGPIGSLMYRYVNTSTEPRLLSDDDYANGPSDPFGPPTITYTGLLSIYAVYNPTCGTSGSTTTTTIPACSVTAPPDLVATISDVSYATNQTVAAGDVQEGCAASTTGRSLLRFGVTTINVGGGNLAIGAPLCPDCALNPGALCGNPLFECSPAGGHGHAHFEDYALYELLDATGTTVVLGHKQGFCLRDTSCPPGITPNYTCAYQGLTAGCGDLYGPTLGCQYLDVTGVPPGNYRLRVTVDPFERVIESREDNNVAEVPVTFP
jgi:Lysyl oxidase